MNLRDKGVTGLSRVSFDFTLKDENSKTIDSEFIKGRYSLVIYVKDLDSKNNKKMLGCFDKKIDILKKNDIQIFVITELPPENISHYKNSEELSLQFYSWRKPDELKHLLIDESGVIDNMVLLFDRWGVKRGYWKSVNNEKRVVEITKTADRLVISDKLLSRTISLRRARRSFREEKVLRKDIERLIKAAHLAPSCFNKQPWRFVAVDDMETLEKLHEYIPDGNKWMHKAPVLLIVYSRQEDDCDLSDNRSYYLFDTGLAVGMLLTQATKMGLLAHPIAGYKPKKFEKTLDLPDDSVLITVIATGYQGESSLLDEKSQKGEITGRKRKPVESVFSWHK
ncbi:MAG: nitroreductase family protein [Thermotogota bacterium]|nr:nitroreductase family protein [Thermotogota bacterium]